MGEYSQQQHGKNQSESPEEIVEFTSQSPSIPQDVEFKPDTQLEEQQEETEEYRDY